MLYGILWLIVLVLVGLLIHWVTPFGIVAGILYFLVVAGFFGLLTYWSR